MQEILNRLGNLKKRFNLGELKIISIFFGIGIFVGFLLCFFVMQRNDDLSKSDDVSASSSDYLVSAEDSESDHSCDIRVEVVGEVSDPGVLCLDAGSIVAEAIDAAGGFSDKVCTDWVKRNINQASLVETNAKIFIPGTDDEECEVLLSQGVQEAPSASGGLISINTASKEDLISISGVGPATAEKIIEGRPYKALEDIKRVKGIGDSTYESIRDSICL
jgi:competence protein ComEA